MIKNEVIQHSQQREVFTKRKHSIIQSQHQNQKQNKKRRKRRQRKEGAHSPKKHQTN